MALKSQKAFVAMSGGVDSSVAAALLRERNFDVVGVFMKNWAPEKNHEAARLPDGQGSMPSSRAPFGPTQGGGQAEGNHGFETVCRQQYQDRIDAMRVAAVLDIPFQTWDFTAEYRQAVVDYMIREYAQGRTPNPDVMCNREIKFGVFLQKALEAGADYVATGHYVRREPEFLISKSQFSINAPMKHSLKIRNCKLKIAKDSNKDQSYFLWTLGQEQLRHCLFPIGEYVKPEVRATARKFGLPTAEKPDSQGICFIGEINVRQFLKDYIPERRGRILTTAGKAVGEHDGIPFYTIGQRQGLGIGGGIPYYVTDKDTATNTLVVAEGPYDGQLFRSELTATDVHWISGREPKFPLKCEARIRYRQPVQPCRVERSKKQEARSKKTGTLLHASRFMLRVQFDEPQRAVTPGQSIVLYQGEIMLGGGVIA